MKHVKRIILGILSLPFVLIALLIAWEIMGACVNHAAGDLQTKHLKQNLTKAIDGIEILEVTQEVGNTSGTGNHVDLLSRITFSTDLPAEEVQQKLRADYPEGGWLLEEVEEGYQLTLVTQAPFPDNYEGH